MIWWSDSASGVVPVGERSLKKAESCAWSTVAPAAVTKPYASVHSERYWPPPGGVALEVPGLSRWKSVRAPSDVEISLRLISVSHSSCHRVARSTL